MAEHATDIRGRVLEVMDGQYAKSLGRGSVESLDILDVDSSNPNATLIVDLGIPGSLPRDSYDCFILTQTLYLIPDLDSAIRNAWACLSPGGVLLITVPTLARLDPVYGAASDYWRLTPAGLRELLHRNLDVNADITSFGNLLTCLATLFGFAAEELTLQEMEFTDHNFPVVTCARLIKAP